MANFCKSLAIALFLIAMAYPVTSHAYDGADENIAMGCEGRKCLAVEYEQALAGEAAVLIDALSIRLAKYGVQVVIGALSEEEEGSAPAENEAPSTTESEKPVVDGGQPSYETLSAPGGGDDGRRMWIVHLRRISGEVILVAVDNMETLGADDVVKEVRRGETPESTAWTMAIMIEEAMVPYLEHESDQAALGAGLAIIEPAVVGGIKKELPQKEIEYPFLRSIGLSLTVYGITAAENFVFGPRFGVEGLFAERLLASISIAWAGWADFVGHGVNGSMSMLPLDVIFGFILLPNKVVEISVHAGFAVGFAIYKTADENRDRTDLLFEPCGQANLRAVFHVLGPWTVFVDGGLVVPFVKDVLENQGEVVFEQEWGFPVFNVGMQLWL